MLYTASCHDDRTAMGVFASHPLKALPTWLMIPSFSLVCSVVEPLCIVLVGAVWACHEASFSRLEGAKSHGGLACAWFRQTE